MAVANSDLERTAGIIKTEEIKYANQIDEPVLAAAIPGNTKILPSIPAMLIAIIAGNVKVLLSFFI